MQVIFTPKMDEKLVAEAEIVFGYEDDSPLAGTKLVGFSIWRAPDGQLYITLPNRTYGEGDKKKYYDLLRSVDGKGDAVKRVKKWLVDEFKKQTGS